MQTMKTEPIDKLKELLAEDIKRSAENELEFRKQMGNTNYEMVCHMQHKFMRSIESVKRKTRVEPKKRATKAVIQHIIRYKLAYAIAAATVALGTSSTSLTNFLLAILILCTKHGE